MNTALLIFIAAFLVWFAINVLERLPFADAAPDFGDAPYVIGFKVDALTETDFDVSYVEAWQTGRQFMLYGPPSSDETLRGGLDFGTRTGVHIYPTGHWFKSSRIGHIMERDAKAGQINIQLPYQIARHVLEDVRQKPQYVTLRFGKKNGERRNIDIPDLRI